MAKIDRRVRVFDAAAERGDRAGRMMPVFDAGDGVAISVPVESTAGLAFTDVLAAMAAMEVGTLGELPADAETLHTTLVLADDLSSFGVVVSLDPLGELAVERPGRPAGEVGTAMAPRLEAVLYALRCGDSEKQIAARLHLSRHTVHQYIRDIYKRLGVSSRGELLRACED